MTITMNYLDAKSQVDKLGWDGFVEMFNEEYRLNFYSCSTYWYDHPEYICKLKGERGDLLIVWG